MKIRTRTYDSSKRRAQAEARKAHMARRTAELMRQRRFGDFTLEEVAERAETTVQTILRAYGSKEALFVEALSKYAVDHVDEEMRDAVASDDIPAFIATLFRLYDRIGDAVIRMLAEEPKVPALKEANDIGRAYHGNTVKTVFGRHLDPLPEPERSILHSALRAVTDIYVWQVLRRDEGRSLEHTIETVTHIVNRLLKEPRP